MDKPGITLQFLLMLFLVSCRAQVPGCMDPLANNFNPDASESDGSCSYDPVALAPRWSCPLPDALAESSGLILYGQHLWTHNDDLDTRLYLLDTVCNPVMQRYVNIEGVVNTNWEEISQDRDYIYLGDLGNNLSGDRSDLHILRIDKQSIHSDNQIIDTISFFYSNQVDLTPAAPNQTEFDCEAFVVTEDSIYLFTKQWTTFHSSLYSIPKRPGNHEAKWLNEFNARGLITGATYMESMNLMVLCGYSSVMQPFFYLLYDFRDYQFFSGNRRRIELLLPLHQVEAVASGDGLFYYVTNESFAVASKLSNGQKVHLFDLREFIPEHLRALMK